MRVLVVDDEVELADVVARGLRQAGFAVDLALDGEKALEKAVATPYEVVVLDRGLPGIQGDEVCRAPDLDRARRTATLRPAPSRSRQRTFARVFLASGGCRPRRARS